MNDQSNIERIVMRRVHIIRTFRPLFSTAGVSTLVLVCALWGIGREVWIAHIFQNAPSRLTDAPNFYLTAFSHTRLIVQALSLITFVSVIYLARETARALAGVLIPTRA